MAKIVTMGELLLRLSPPNNKKLIQAESFDAHYGGSEANVAVSLKMLGHDSVYVTKLPDNSIGHAAKMTLDRYGVDTSKIAVGGQRLGLYFLEIGSALRPSNVVYDRADSAISKATVEDFDFREIFKGADWFHFSGITPAISKNGYEITKAAVKAAKEMGVTVSCDLNYRKKLWTSEEAHDTMTELMEYVDVLMGGREDAIKVLGFQLSNRNEDDTPDLDAYEKMFKEVKDTFNLKYVICSMRRSFNSSDNELGGLIYDGEKLYSSATYRITPMVDRVGGGDAFAAGMVAALAAGKNPQESVEFATAASVLKHTIPGDLNIATKEEIETLINEKGAGRVSR